MVSRRGSPEGGRSSHRSPVDLVRVRSERVLRSKLVVVLSGLVALEPLDTAMRLPRACDLAMELVLIEHVTDDLVPAKSLRQEVGDSGS